MSLLSRDVKWLCKALNVRGFE